VPVGLARLWIPAFAGMTMKAKAAGMGGSSENRSTVLLSAPAVREGACVIAITTESAAYIGLNRKAASLASRPYLTTPIFFILLRRKVVRCGSSAFERNVQLYGFCWNVLRLVME